MSTADDAGLARQVLLVEPDAGGAGDALEDQRGLALVRRERPHETFLHLGMVVQSQFPQDGGKRLARPLRQRIAVAVVVVEAVVDDGLRHRLAAGAAHGARRAVDGRGEARAVRNRQAAVIAGIVRGCHGSSFPRKRESTYITLAGSPPARG
jgi:hypothetical protein